MCRVCEQKVSQKHMPQHEFVYSFIISPFQRQGKLYFMKSFPAWDSLFLYVFFFSTLSSSIVVGFFYYSPSSKPTFCHFLCCTLEIFLKSLRTSKQASKQTKHQQFYINCLSQITLALIYRNLLVFLSSQFYRWNDWSNLTMSNLPSLEPFPQDEFEPFRFPAVCNIHLPTFMGLACLRFLQNGNAAAVQDDCYQNRRWHTKTSRNSSTKNSQMLSHRKAGFLKLPASIFWSQLCRVHRINRFIYLFVSFRQDSHLYNNWNQISSCIWYINKWFCGTT